MKSGRAAAARQALAGAQPIDRAARSPTRGVRFGLGAHRAQRLVEALPSCASAAHASASSRCSADPRLQPSALRLHVGRRRRRGQRHAGALEQQAGARGVARAAPRCACAASGASPCDQRKLHAEHRPDARAARRQRGVGDLPSALCERRVGARKVAQQGRRQRAGVQQPEALVGAGRASPVELLQALARRHGGVHQHARARLHQRVFGPHQACASAGALARTRLADALGGQRVAAQVRVAAVVVQPRGVVQLLEHARHARRREAGAGQHREADAVGLALHVAREVELALHGRRLAAGDGRLCGIGAVGAAGRDQRRGSCRPAPNSDWRLLLTRCCARCGAA